MITTRNQILDVRERDQRDEEPHVEGSEEEHRQEHAERQARIFFRTCAASPRL
jgi:hypothetical protein